MTRELERAELALDQALAGESVALVSGGDAGVYGMASVVFELACSRGIALGPGGLDLEVVPGTPAVTAAAALLGAPLSHDFACISLSDRLTPWEEIERRLDLTAQADLVIALYNPKSRGRTRQYGRALEIISHRRSCDTPVGIVSRAGREGEKVLVATLGRAGEADVDMQTLVIVGNSRSFTYLGYMITPRGYMDKYGDGSAR
jgi:precorrin-3B C17-methyltransferase